MYREKYFFLSACLLSALCFALAAYLALRRTSMESDLDRHHFNRAAIIAVKQKTGILSPADAMRLMNNPATLGDGLLAVLSRTTAAQLQALPEVEHIFPISKTENKLSLAGGFSGNITTFYVPPQFVSAFALGDASLLKKDVFVPSTTLQRKISIAISTGSPLTSATLGPVYDGKSGLLKKHMSSEEAAKYKVPVWVSDSAFLLPGGSAAFDNTLFATGEPVKLNIPGMLSFPKIWLVVKLKDGVDATAALQSLRNLTQNSTDRNNEKNLTFTPLTNYFAGELSTDYLESWANRLHIGTGAMAALLLLMLVLTRYARIRREVALRLAMGATGLHAAWLSIRQTVFAILAGIATTSTLTFALLLLQPALLLLLLPMFGIIALIGVTAFFLLFGCGALAGRGDLMPHLRGAW